MSYLDDLMVDLGDTVEKPPMTEKGYSETLELFWEARDIATRALYKDIGIRPKGEPWILRLRWSTSYRRLRRLIGRPLTSDEELDEEVEMAYGPRVRRMEQRRRETEQLQRKIRERQLPH